MAYTEAEAKTKWCPLVRTAAGGPDVVGNVSVNRWDDATLPTASMCIGSDCMAWRWGESRKRFLDETDFTKVEYTGCGYCGAFGEQP